MPRLVVPASTSKVVLSAADGQRSGVTIYNRSPERLDVFFNRATPTATVDPYATFNVPDRYTGPVQGQWRGSASGHAEVLTPGGAGGESFARIVVIDGDEERPDVEFALWVGGLTRPVGMAEGDVWLKEGEDPGEEEPPPDPGDPLEFTFSEYEDIEGMLDDGWDFTAKTSTGEDRDTYTAPLQIEVTGDGVESVAQSGDIYGNQNNSVNTLFHDLPADWTAVELVLSFNPGDAWHAAGVAVYVHDDSFFGIARGCAAEGSGQNVYSNNEVSGTPNEEVEPTTAEVEMVMRIERNGSTLTAKFSEDGESFVTLDEVSRTLASPRVCLFAGGATAPTPVATAVFHSLKIEVPA